MIPAWQRKLLFTFVSHSYSSVNACRDLNLMQSSKSDFLVGRLVWCAKPMKFTADLIPRYLSLQMVFWGKGTNTRGCRDERFPFVILQIRNSNSVDGLTSPSRKFSWFAFIFCTKERTNTKIQSEAILVVVLWTMLPLIMNEDY